MKYKALISDVDGTLIPNHMHGIPSQKVIQAIRRAKDYIHIGVATARPYRLITTLAQMLELSGPSIIHSGAQVMDINSGTIYRQHELQKGDIEKIYAIAQNHKKELFVDKKDSVFTYTPLHTAKEPMMGAYITELTAKEADTLLEEFAHIPTIAAVKISSWTDGKLDVSISPLQATKQHGMLEVAEILGIQTKEIIAIGDSYNDFPLLLSAGLKVAIGNAVPELKAIADYVAPSVEDDGVVDVIEKFVLAQ